MSEMIAKRVRERLETLGLTPAEATRRGGLGRTYIYDLLKKGYASHRSGQLEKLAVALETTPGWLVGEEAPITASRRVDVPVYGTAAGSAVGAVRMETEPVDWLPRPAALIGARDVYATYVAGTSMLQRFRPGEPVLAHPYRPVRAGDHVIVQTQNRPDGDIEAFVKEFVRNTENSVICKQYNPESSITFERRHVVAVHRVLTTAELLGIA